MKTLYLNLKRKWFDMIESGEKPEEYREIKDHWMRRLIFASHEIEGDVWQGEFMEDLNDPNRRHSDIEECLKHFGASFREYDNCVLKNGYARDGRPAPTIVRNISGIRIDFGKPEWGAEPGKVYFAIELEKPTFMKSMGDALQGKPVDNEFMKANLE